MPPEKPRLLFVDDEEDLLRGLRTSLRKERNHWDMRFECGAAAGLAALDEESADVVVCDMRMPGMDGAEFLARVRDKTPGALRIVLSGEADEALTLRAVPMTHIWIAKPCERDVLVRTIDRALTTRDLLEGDCVRQVIGRVGSLPALPRLYAELQAALCDPDVDIEQVTALIERDASICAKILQLVNSAFFSLPRRIVALQDAVALLGLSTISHLVLSSEVFAALRPMNVAGFDWDDFSRSSLATGRLASRMLEPDRDAAGVAAIAGLLQDIGRLVIVRYMPERFTSICARVGSGEDTLAAERAEIGTTHAEVGAALLAMWGLPSDVVDAVAHHHEPRRVPSEGFDVITAVHVADGLVGQALQSSSGSERSPFDLSLVEELGMGEHLDEWTAMAAEEVRSAFRDDGKDAA